MATSKELRLTEIPGRGRSLVAAQPLKGGQIILRDSPILLYSALPLFPPNPTNPYSYCDHCFKTLNPKSAATFPICPSCSTSLFCSPTCLSAAQSSSHTPWVCQSLSNLRNCPSPLKDQTSDRQVQSRFLIAAYNLAATSPQSFQTLVSLQGHPHDCAETLAAARLLNSVISSICCPHPSQPFSVELTAALLVKEKLNAFGLMEPFSELSQRSSRAYAIYPNASFFNHDCLPNACRFDYIDSSSDGHNSTDMVIRMIHDVPEGREICLSYFPVNQSYSNRQRTLAEDYGFVCQCDRCKVEANWSDNEVVEEEEEEEGAAASGSAEVMDEDIDQEMEHDSGLESGSDIGAQEQQGEADFPHAYFFIKFMCSRTNCWGTLAPLPPKDDGTCSDVMECNVCGSLKKDEEATSHGQNGFAVEC